MKPSRSDEIQSAEEEQQRSKQVQEHFNSLAPKRVIKPERSEPGLINPGSQAAGWVPEQEIPEHLKLLDLEARSETLITQGGVVEADGYVENDYYKDLISVDDGYHHTTGTGFINVTDGTEAAVLHLVDDYGNAPFPSAAMKCNPATNDWIPAPHQSFLQSDKPGRSEP